MKNLTCCILAVFLVSCGSSDFSFECANKSAKSMKVDSITLKKVIIDKFETSLIGFTVSSASKLYFFDQITNNLFEIDTVGRMHRRLLGKGRSNKEYAYYCDGVVFCGENRFALVGDVNVCFYDLTDDGLNLVYDKFIYKKASLSTDMPSKYESYSILSDKLRLRIHNNLLYLSIAGNHPLFNMFIPGYFDNARIIRALNIGKNEPANDQILGRLSPSTSNAAGRNQFFMFDYDLDEAGNFYVTYELDSLIYKFDTNFQIIETYGNSGANMNISTQKRLSLSDFKSNYQSVRDSSAHYKFLRKIGDHTFRTYQNSNKAYDRLQIYEGNVLIGDIQVPKNTQVISKIGDYYFTNIIGDEKNGEIWFYKFKV